MKLIDYLFVLVLVFLLGFIVGLETGKAEVKKAVERERMEMLDWAYHDFRGGVKQ